ncbi:tetratricopeptide repeat protein [Cystobacter fuscus]|uniref:tetratricopeptide repeat protein n=1 Tax=Cystobacter fuscus TaxID=43 RepID=UPI002B2FC2A7|nr:tetratricopeptide repeat protein [Cystobacter fuscus]
MDSLSKLLAMGRIEEASEQAKKRLQQDPGDARALLALAKIALVRGGLEEAEALLNRAASKAPAQDVTLLRAGLAGIKGDWDAARGLYESLTRQPQAPAEAWYGLGMAFAARKELQAACEALEQAVELNPDQPSFRFELGRALTLLDRPRAAVYHLVQGVRIDPRDERGFRVIADILSPRHPVLARRVLELGLRQVPGSALLREALAPPGAPADAAGASTEEEALIQQVNGLLDNKQYREARKLLREASEKGLRSAGLKLLEADTCEALFPPDIAGAARAYEDAVELAPREWVTHSNLGLFILRQGGMHEVSRAIQVLEEARRLDPTRPEPALNLALAYHKGGRDTEAADLARRLVHDLPAAHPLAVQARQLAESLAG